MHSFKDTAGRQWHLSLDVAAKIAIRERTGVDLFKLRAKAFAALADFLDDDEQFLAAVWVLIEDQAGKHAVSRDQFNRALTGKEIELANDAFAEELADFFSGPRGEALRKMIRAGDLLNQQADAELAELTPERIVATILSPAGAPQTSSATSGSVPASSACGPAAGPTGSS